MSIPTSSSLSSTTIVADYVAAHVSDPAMFDLRYHHFDADDPIDPGLAAAFDAQRETFIDDREPKEVLLGIARNSGWNDEDERLLATVSAEDFQAMFEGTEGRDLKRLVQTAIRMSGYDTDFARAMRPAVQTALCQIAAKSPLRARRLAFWGFRADSGDAP